MRKPTFWFPTSSDTNQAVQSQKIVRGSKFWIKKVEGLSYLCSENKGAEQLRGYREADLRLCFRLCKKPVFSRRGSYAYRRFSQNAANLKFHELACLFRDTVVILHRLDLNKYI